MTDAATELPRAFGPYLLFEKIGQGGMAEIFLARVSTDLGGARYVVVKQILPELSGDARFAQMLVAEAKLAAGLRHANVVQVIDLGREEDRLFIAMEYVEGFDLKGLLRKLTKARIALPAEFAVLIVREVLAALDYAHRARGQDGQPLGLVHRDVSPSNVLLSFEGEIKLCDFGIARALDTEAADATEASLLEKARVVGKSAYMAPEHARGESIDARADVYSAAILLWELAAGRRLRKGTEQEMLAQSREGYIEPLPDNGLPGRDELQAIMDRALAFERDERYASAAEMLRALDAWAAKHKLLASQLRLGAFLTDHFAAELVEARRERERSAAQKLDSDRPRASHENELESVTADEPPQSAPASDIALQASSAATVTATVTHGEARSAQSMPSAPARPNGTLVAIIVTAIALFAGFAWWLSAQ